MSRRIVVLRGSPEELVDRIRAVRTAGDVPLVGDERWPAATWAAVRELAATPVPYDAAWACLTSGTSGTPRVVLRTAASWERSFGAVSTLLGAGAALAEQRILLPAPPASSLTLFSLAHALAGGPRPLFPGSAEAGSATLFHGTPHALRTVVESHALPRLRTALVGGSHVDAGLRTAADAQGVEVISYYGAAELSFVAVDRGDGLRAFPGVDFDVRGGELWVRSPYVALGYVGGPGPLRTDGPRTDGPGTDGPGTDGSWASVGDLATIEDGALVLRGRADSAILTASATVIPDEVEAGLRAIPGIADAVVFGLPTDGIGALVAALVEPRPDAPTLTARRLRAAVAAGFAPAHRPRAWFTGPLPRTVSGKPARAEVLRRVLAGEVARLA